MEQATGKKPIHPIEVLARAYGRGFNSQCEVDPYGGAVSYAAYGAQTDDVIAQIRANKGFFYVPQARAWITEYPKEGVSKADAEAAKKKLEEAGAKAELK